MSLTLDSGFPTIAIFQNSLSSSEIQQIVEDRRIKVVQTSRPADRGTWERLNAEFFRVAPA